MSQGKLSEWLQVLLPTAKRADGATAEQVVTPLRGYLHRMEMILADAAYEKVFLDWVTEKLLGVELEISYRPAGSEGFVPIKWRWVSERGLFNFSRRLDKDYEKITKSAEAWILWQNCKLIFNRLDSVSEG